ncbi:hypothetical protein [Paenibacillus montanisoli]|uniref:Competence protein CoiA n=1 Tax=Paenibacillus montanisoli TaxID=2081970 RepID=A0A328U0G7_9BACL|nr:hypothetical protein [Paenibacillus montanisoli]RAP75532.1 hypothetical protein DL346_19545 [Paenibacillus montanisoli]
MEAARLHNQTIYIERERNELVTRRMNAEQINAVFEHKYRIFSREKGSFRCGCCGERVVMVLYRDKALFRHYNSEQCAGERNYATYLAGRETLQETSLKQAAGKEVLHRAFMLANPGHYTVEEGYLFRKELRYVPDFIVTFPSGEQWAIDYIAKLRGDSAFRKKIDNRLRCYSEHRLKPLFLIDRSYLAVHGERDISFNYSESRMAVPHNDYCNAWEQYITGQSLDQELYRNYFGTSAVNVQSLLYIDVESEKGHFARFLHLSDKWGELLFDPCEMPLDQLLSVDERLLRTSGRYSFSLYADEESFLMYVYTDGLERRLQTFEEENERRRIEEEQAKRAHPSAVAVQVRADIDKLQELLLRCQVSPNRPMYPSLEPNLAKAEAYIALYHEGGELAESHYRSAFSILTNISYPLLGE